MVSVQFWKRLLNPKSLKKNKFKYIYIMYGRRCGLEFDTWYTYLLFLYIQVCILLILYCDLFSAFEQQISKDSD